MENKNLYDLIIIGGGPAGCSGGIYAGRANLCTLMIDAGGAGGQIGITGEVVNYPGIASVSGAELMETMKNQAKDFGVEYLQAGVLSVDAKDEIKTVKTSAGDFQTLAILIATGAVPRMAGFEGEEAFKGRGVGYCATCDGAFFEGCDIFVIGGGLAACEEAIFLTRFAKKVYLVVRKPQLRCPDSIAQEVLNHEKIEVLFQTRMLSVSGENTLESATLIDDAAGKEWTYKPETGENFGIFVFVGYQPASEAFQNLVETNEEGYIRTDETLKTNLDGVYAAGDIRPKALRQLVTAVSDGAVAATSAEPYISSLRKKLGLGAVAAEKKQPEPAAKKQSVLSADVEEQLKPLLDSFASEVHLAVVLEGDPAISNQIVGLVDSLTGLTENVQATIVNRGENPALEAKIGTDRYPVIAVLDKDENPVGIQFHGIPGGHEFTSFILALYNVAGPGQQIDAALEQEILQIKQKTLLQVGITLSCTMCPETVQAAQKIASLNPNVQVEIIDASIFSDFREQYHIMSVPCTVINEEDVMFGRMSLPELFGKVKDTIS